MFFVYFCLLAIYTKNVAIIINTSKDYSNYRHTSNILLMQKILTDLNPAYDKILVLSTDDILNNARNTKPNYFYIDRDIYFNGHIPLTNLSCNILLNILNGNHPLLLTIDIDTNVFVYICGHGGDGFLKVLDREFMLKKDLTESLITLSNKINNLLIILDTCQAESILDISDFKDNTSIIITSKKGEPSVSDIASNVIGCHVVDGFMRTMYDKYEQIKGMWLEEMIREFSYERVGSTVMCFGRKCKFGEFIEHKEECKDRDY